ncbi:hypothetical protein M9458_038095, partial [Cirrhinus mrigala]
SFSFLFFSLQEELRELREQPTDPQAEQEIIDSIEEVYFSSDSFDMVQYELEVCV